jgi:hypothetical protein
MKKFLYPIMILTCTILLTNCKKDTDDNNKLGIFGPDGTWKATINGTAKEGAFSGGTYQDDKILLISLDQNSNATERITIQIIESPNTIKAGNTYSFDGSYKKDGVQYVIFSPDLGTITLTKFDEVNKLVSGTLSFKARQSFSSPVDELQVTNAEFVNVPFIID